MKVLIDGKEVRVLNDVEIVYDDIYINGEDDEDGTLNIRATSEGLIMDVWGSKKTHLDTNFGTDSELAQDIADGLCEENE